jgi:predicted transposase YdaD
MNMKVLTVVIYSEYRDKELRPKPEYTSDIKGEVINRFTYLDIWLMDYEEEIRNGKLAPLAPFLLEMTTIPTEETVFMAKRMATHCPNDERRHLLLSLVALLAGRHFDKEHVKKWFIKEAKMIRTNTFIDDWLEEAEEKGREEGITEGIELGHQEGLTEGKLTTRREAILDLLGLRFDPPFSLYQQVEERLSEIDDLATLETIFVVAVRGETLSELQTALSEAT